MSQPITPEHIVVIDDDYAMRLSCRQILARSGHGVETCGDGTQGLAAVAATKPSLVVVDLKMPGLPGIEVVRRLHEIDPGIVVVVITGYATIDTAIEAMKAGAYDFLPKPFSPDQLRLIVERGLERRRLQLESRRFQVERELLRHRFVSFVSHQLKSPLAAIHQYLGVLQRLDGTPDIEAKRRHWIERCLERSDEMRRLIDDWLTLARVERESLVGSREPVDLAPILGRALDAHREGGAHAGLRMELELADGPLVVPGDPTCLSVLFDNLVDNAVKYNREGGSVTVTARPQTGEVVVEVRDTGQGIPEEARPFLFDEFFRVGGHDTTRGSGLGLAICRRIAAELAGAIEVDSVAGEGSTFRVRLPAWNPEPHEIENPMAEPLTLKESA